MDITDLLQQIPLTALAAIIAGLVVLLVPRVLNYAIAVYLLLIGVLGLMQFVQGGPVRIQPVVAVVAGVLVLAKPQILSWVVGGYLILIGLLDAGVLRF